MKASYYIERFLKIGNIWQELNLLKGNDDNTSPTKIIHENKEISSPKKMAEMFNQFFVKKIKDIQEKFNPNDDDQIPLLERLIRRPNTKLEVNFITINEVYDAITWLRTSNSCGYDQMSSRIIKMIPELMAFWLTHLLNQMLRTGTFPRILKISKITPVKKPRKMSTDKSSFRPICNLQVCEKVIEEVLKRKMIKYFEDNDLIVKEQHGGRKNHNTITAKAVIEEACRKNLDKNKLGLVISTDLTAAFNTVNHRILYNKLQFYGVDGRLLKLIKSYLSNRYQYVEI